MFHQTDLRQAYNVRKKWLHDFSAYARECLTIQSKDGALMPLELNTAQHYLHTAIEHQRRQTGRVRVLVLKGRQQGCSTYVEGRLMWQLTHRLGHRAFILTHAMAASQHVLTMAQRFYDHLPDHAKPHVSVMNQQELVFDRLDSSIGIGTAGARAVGRSQTLHYVHGSEVAFWPNAEEHMAGLMQAVPAAEGTEVILESTANGTHNWFYDRWQQAIPYSENMPLDQSSMRYLAVFIPWYWQDEYQAQIGSHFVYTDDELAIMQEHRLTPQQLMWRRMKIAELGHVQLFDREYPLTATHAFQQSDQLALIPLNLVQQASSRDDATFHHTQSAAPRLLGVDPARFGDDRTAWVMRCGRVVERVESASHLDTMQIAARTIELVADGEVDKVMIDVIGIGAGVVDRMRQLGFGDKVIAVAASQRAHFAERYSNKRAEMWDTMRAWLAEPPIVWPRGCDALLRELTMVRATYDAMGKLKLESKDALKQRGNPSPDLADALALTFAVPVSQQHTRRHQSLNYLPQE